MAGRFSDEPPEELAATSEQSETAAAFYDEDAAFDAVHEGDRHSWPNNRDLRLEKLTRRQPATALPFRRAA